MQVGLSVGHSGYKPILIDAAPQRLTRLTWVHADRIPSRYVDYAMHRVRLLRHHHIEPYIVFDGGPLPAKKGTESDRKLKREENLARANALAVQGRHGQAREYYVKCVDVTPQMAFQFIKVSDIFCAPPCEKIGG